MRNRKKTITTLLTAAILLIAVFAAGRYGWKLLGFRACEEAGIESVEVSETTVTVKGFCPGSFPEGFCGYYAEEQDGTVFVGFRFSAVFGFFKTGDFEVSIPTRGEIRKVVLKTGLAERTIWTAESGASSGSLPSEANTPAELDGFGVYVKLEREDASSVALQADSFTKVCENADGSLLKAGEWLFTGEDLAQLSQEENRSVLFTVSARDADDTLLGEGTFLYDTAQEKLYVTISADGVTCSTSDAADAPADVPPVLTLPILDEIDASVTVGTAGSSLLAVQAAAKLLDWGVNTGLDTDEISEAASTWLAAKNNDLTECLQKLELVDDAYQKLLTGEAWELLDSAGCADVEITWGSDPVEPVEAILRAAGLRG